MITKCELGSGWDDVVANLVFFIGSSFGCSGIKMPGRMSDDPMAKVNFRLISKIAYSIVFIAFAIYFGVTIAPSLILHSDNSTMTQQNHR